MMKTSSENNITYEKCLYTHSIESQKAQQFFLSLLFLLTTAIRYIIYLNRCSEGKKTTENVGKARRGQRS